MKTKTKKTSKKTAAKGKKATKTKKRAIRPFYMDML